MNTKPSIAIVIPGGIGIDDNIPVLLDLLCRLSNTFEVFAYSFSLLEVHPTLLSASCTVTFAPRIFQFNVTKALYFLWKIRKDHAVKHFSVIHGFWIFPQGLLAVLLGKLFNLPTVVTLPGGDITYIPEIHYGGISNPFKKILAGWCIHHASEIVLLTRFQQATMQKHGIRRENVSIIPYGIDVDRFKFRPHQFSHPLELVFIGNLNRVKDPFTVLHVFSLLLKKYDCRLTLIGSDILKGTVQAYARTLGVYDYIRWKGKLSYEQIPIELSSSDILLVTSLFEGQAVVVLEAFASGVLVVGTNVGLLADIGDDRTTAAPKDAAGLSDRIDELIRHPERMNNLLLQNRGYAESFSAGWTFEQYTKLYYSLIEPHRH
jgi:glycosyltransferase involved in cell wall biosynthesis